MTVDDMTPMSTGANLARLRSLFSSERVTKYTNGHPITAYILPSTDAHQSEYLADRDFRARFLSGFTGSNAKVVVTDKQALLWTDGRYFLQAAKQLDSNWVLMKEGTSDEIKLIDWVAANLPSGTYVGFDPDLLNYANGAHYFQVLKRMGIQLVSIPGNLIDEFWTDRPKLSGNKLTILSTAETGESVESKLNQMRKAAAAQKCVAIVFGELADIMWVLNVRGSDIPNNPLTFSYLLITKTDAHLFIDESKLDDKIRAHLTGVTVHPYEEAANFMTEWNERESKKEGYRVFVPTSTNYRFASIFAEHMIMELSPATVDKAIKNEVEMQGMRDSSIRDSVALVEYLMWLESEMQAGRNHSEDEVAAKLDGLRAKLEKFVSLSFPTVSATGEHAANAHYDGGEGETLVTADKVYLVDSGAHYRDGTTDVTRTIWIKGEKPVPEDFIHQNTLVLRGHIQLAKIQFPKGILGIRLDGLTRQFMWQEGLDFGHGTGHGVGHYLNVHEGPANIAHRNGGGVGGIFASSVLTIEPGFYLEGKWGIRIENCYEVVKSKKNAGFGDFLAFEPLTLAPIQTSIVDKSLMTKEEIDWLNAYHDRVLHVIGAILKKDGKKKELEWLTAKCAHI